MVDKKLVSNLKRTDIGKDPEKVKTRVRDAWNDADKAAREEILDMAGIKLASMQRVYKNGSISIKVVLPLAQVMNLDPYFLLGETDDSGVYSVDLALALLKEQGYKKEVSSLAKKKGWESRRRALPAEEAVAGEAVAEAAEEASEPAALAHAPEPALQFEAEALEIKEAALLEDEYQMLLRALILRAKFNPKSAEALRQVEQLLIEG